jgi:hypothetical protein
VANPRRFERAKPFVKFAIALGVMKFPETLLTYPYNKHCADVQSKLNREIAWNGSRQYLSVSCGSASSEKPGGPRNCRALIALNINRSSYFLTMPLDWLFPTRSMTSNFIGQPAFPLRPGSATQSLTTPLSSKFASFLFCSRKQMRELCRPSDRPAFRALQAQQVRLR